MSQEQLVASPREPTFVVVCPFCGATLDVIELEWGEKWSVATGWGYIAQKHHEETDCPEYVKQLELPSIWWWER